jgi:hypothetical protein
MNRPARRRVAVWRELRKAAALSLGQAPGRSAEDAARFQVLFTAARSAAWAESLADCGRRLKQCAAACEDYAERVFAAPHRTPAPRRTPEGRQ